MASKLAGIGPKDRLRLSAVLKNAPKFLSPKSTAKALKIARPEAAQLLARWNQNGWVSRVKRGTYVPVPLSAQTSDVMVDEPAALAQELFAPCYIGGWSAAEHWGFTEQIFSATFVFTTRKFASREMHLKGANFQLKTIVPKRLFATKAVWLENQKVLFSDPHKTIADAFNDPSCVGGIRMTVDILTSYLESEHRDLNTLLSYAVQLNNSAALKRLGFVFAKRFSHETRFIQSCRKAIKTGYSELDPSVPGDNLITEWNLWVPKAWK